MKNQTKKIELPQDVLNQLYKKFREGRSLTKLGNDIGISRTTLTNLFVEHCGYVIEPHIIKHVPITDAILQSAKTDYENGMSLCGICRKYNLHRNTLTKRLKAECHVQILPDGKKRVNSMYFHAIDTAEKAYWLGFLYADGYNSGRGVEFSLQEADKDSVFAFKKAIGSEHAVSRKIAKLNGKKFASYRISIKDQQLAKDLENLGCMRNKSKKIRMPNLSNNLMPHFIRGYFDGDGSVSVYKERNNMVSASFTSGSIAMLTELIQVLQNQISCFRGSISIDKRRSSTYSLNISQKSIVAFAKYIYGRSNPKIRLKRKYLHFMSNAVLRQQLQESQDDKGEIKRGNGCKTATRTEGAA